MADIGRIIMVNLNFAEIAQQAFINILESPGVVEDGVVYKYDSSGNKVATDTPEDDIKAEMDRVRNEVQYKSERSVLYPSVVEQLDQLWHGMDADESKRIEPFYSNIKTIKDTYPKDGSNNTPLQIITEEQPE
jgi:hypothetical protein